LYDVGCESQVVSGIMRTISSSIAALLPLLIHAALCIPAVADEPAGTKLDSIFAPLTDARSPGAAVLILKNGRPVFQRAYGVRDLRTFTRIDARTDFRLASCTKQFTATAIMLLVRDGRLRYDEKLTDLFPDFPAYGGSITIRHLLTHTSGLPDYEELMEKVAKNAGPIWSASHQIHDEQVLELLQKQAVGKFPPGTRWAYSNSGYVVLGLIVAKVSGKPFGQFLRDRIFTPLRMTDTLACVSGKDTVPNRAYGHTKEADRFIQTDQSATSATLGDGGIYSNLKDLSNWNKALTDYTLLSEQEMKPALTPVKLDDGSQPHWPLEADDDNLAPGQPVSYGFGWFLNPYDGRARMWHSGTTMGFRSVIERFTGEKLTIVVLCNRADFDPSKLALQAAQLFFRKQ
jgi:CubicO group peptidase (beta-lactamase class C family)